MTKKKYLRSLRKALKGIPEREKEKLIEYYDELIDESFERGKTSNEVFRSLGSPQQVASDYFNANEGPVGGFNDDYDRPPRRSSYYDEPPRRNPYYEEPPRREDYYDYNDEQRRRVNDRYARPAEPKKSSTAGGFFKLLLLPFRIVLAVVLFVLGLAALIVGAVLVLAVVAVVVCLFVAGLYCIAMSFGLFAASWEIATTQIGVGVLLLGISVVAALLVAPTARGFGSFASKLFHRFQGAPKERTVRSHGRTVATLAVGLCLILVGGGAGAFGFGKLEWNWRNLAVLGDYVEHTETLSLENLSALTVEADNLSLAILPTTGEPTLVYSDNEELPKTYQFENGVLTISGGEWERDTGAYFREVWSRGILFPVLEGFENEVKLYLPESYTGALTLSVKNGSCAMEELALGQTLLNFDNGATTVKNSTFTTLSVSAKNGAVRLDGVNSNSLSVETGNGAVNLSEVSADTVTVKTENGAITIDRVEGNELSFTVGNGAVTGSIVGAKEDFQITASVGVGTCNLFDTATGERTLNVRTGCGAIRIDFVSE